MNKQKGYTLYEMLMVAMFGVIAAGVVGWVMNIIAIIHSDFVWTSLLIIRVIGVFIVPIGAVLGYF